MSFTLTRSTCDRICDYTGSERCRQGQVQERDNLGMLKVRVPLDSAFRRPVFLSIRKRFSRTFGERENLRCECLLAQQIELFASIYGAFDQFEAIDLAFDLNIAIE